MQMSQAEGHVAERAVALEARRGTHAQQVGHLHLLLHALQVDVVAHLVLVTRHVQADLLRAIKQRIDAQEISISSPPLDIRLVQDAVPLVAKPD